MGFVYERKVNYYETDRMGVVHHSNYIRYLEESRCEWMAEIGLPFELLEKNNVTIPVLGVNVEYKHHITYGDTILIKVWTKEYNSVRMTCGYEVTNKENGQIVLTGETKHCFTTKELKPVSLKKYKPEFDEILKKDFI